MTYFWFATLACVLVSTTALPRQAPGSFHPIPSDDPHLQPSVNFAAASVNQRCNCLFCQTLVAVTNASEKIVSGAVYAFSMSLQESDKCRYSQCTTNVSSSDCPPNPKAEAYWCDATVLAKPWTSIPYVIQELSCRQ